MKEKDTEFRTVRGYQLMEKNKRLLTAAMEDYLEMMYRETMSDHLIRISTLARHLNVNPSSATKMVQRLGQLGMVVYQKYGIVHLSDRGLELGEYLYRRHAILEAFLQFIIPQKDCLHETELLEHNISPDTLDALQHLNAFFELHPDIMKKYRAFVEAKTD